MRGYGLVGLLALVVAVGAAWADPATIMVQSGAASPLTDETDVRLVAEDLTVDLHEPDVAVGADMLFRNEGGRRELLIGFPQINNRHWGEVVKLHNVRFVVDDQQVPCEHLPQGEEGKSLGLEEGFEYLSWYAATVTFDPGQERRIVITYNHDHGIDYQGVAFFPYLLRTASFWKGSVERLDMVLNYGESTRGAPWRLPEGAVHDEAAHRIACHWTNYEGDPDSIRIHWWPNRPTVYVNGEPGKLRVGLMADGFAVTLGSGEELLGYSSRPGPEAPRGWVIEAADHRLEVTGDSREATLDGQPFELTRAAEVVREGDGSFARGHCRLAAADLQRAFGLQCIFHVGKRVTDFRP